MSAAPDLSRLSPEMAALLLRVAAETGPQVDPTDLAAGRGPLAFGRGQPAVERRAAGNGGGRRGFCRGGRGYRLGAPAPQDTGAAGRRLRCGGLCAWRRLCLLQPESHERCARVLALECGLPVLLPDYRLAPENPYPAGLMDVVATIRNAFAVSAPFGVAAGPLLLSGDSAGANLALAALLHEAAAGRPRMAGALLFYGTYAVDFRTESYRNFENGPGLTTAKMQRYWRWYVGDRDVSADPLACPLLASDEALAALPPLHLMAAGVDPLLSDSIALHQRLKQLGRGEALMVVPGVTHGFLQNTLDLAAAREALAKAGAEARRMAGAN